MLLLVFVAEAVIAREVDTGVTGHCIADTAATELWEADTGVTERGAADAGELMDDVTHDWWTKEEVGVIGRSEDGATGIEEVEEDSDEVGWVDDGGHGVDDATGAELSTCTGDCGVVR